MSKDERAEKSPSRHKCHYATKTIHRRIYVVVYKEIKYTRESSSRVIFCLFPTKICALHKSDYESLFEKTLRKMRGLVVLLE